MDYHNRPEMDDEEVERSKRLERMRRLLVAKPNNNGRQEPERERSRSPVVKQRRRVNNDERSRSPAPQKPKPKPRKDKREEEDEEAKEDEEDDESPPKNAFRIKATIATEDFFDKYTHCRKKQGERVPPAVLDLDDIVKCINASAIHAKYKDPKFFVWIVALLIAEQMAKCSSKATLDAHIRGHNRLQMVMKIIADRVMAMLKLSTCDVKQGDDTKTILRACLQSPKTPRRIQLDYGAVSEMMGPRHMGTLFKKYVDLDVNEDGVIPNGTDVTEVLRGGQKTGICTPSFEADKRLQEVVTGKPFDGCAPMGTSFEEVTRHYLDVVMAWLCAADIKEEYKTAEACRLLLALLHRLQEAAGWKVAIRSFLINDAAMEQLFLFKKVLRYNAAHLATDDRILPGNPRIVEKMRGLLAENPKLAKFVNYTERKFEKMGKPRF